MRIFRIAVISFQGMFECFFFQVRGSFVAASPTIETLRMMPSCKRPSLKYFSFPFLPYSSTRLIAERMSCRYTRWSFFDRFIMRELRRGCVRSEERRVGKEG